MLLHEIITERWQKGSLTTKQLVQLVKNFVGEKGTVTELSKEQQRKTGETVKVEMFFHDFLSTFGPKRSVDEIMQRVFDSEKLTKDMHINWHLYSPEEIKQARKNEMSVHKLLKKIHSSAISKVRSIVPHGWMLTGNFESFSSFSLPEDKITFYIKRDYTQKVENREVYYHVTKSSSLANIKSKGLVPADNKRLSFDGYRNRVFLSTSYPSFEFVNQLITGNLLSIKDTEIAILKISLPTSFETYHDDQADDAVFVEQTIPPEYIEVIYSGFLSKMPDNS